MEENKSEIISTIVMRWSFLSTVNHNAQALLARETTEQERQIEKGNKRRQNSE